MDMIRIQDITQLLVRQPGVTYVQVYDLASRPLAYDHKSDYETSPDEIELRQKAIAREQIVLVSGSDRLVAASPIFANGEPVGVVQ